MYSTVGDIFPYAGTFLPAGLLYCNGQTVSATKWPALQALLAARYGGDYFTTIGVPDIPPLVTDDGKKIPYVIVGDGTPFGSGMYGLMGEVRPFAVPPPQGSPLAAAWIPCDGRTLVMADFNALLSLINPAYPASTFTIPTLPPIDGGNGQVLAHYLCVAGAYPWGGGCDATQYSDSGATYERLMGSLLQVIWTPTVAGDRCGLMLCRGQVLPVNTSVALASVIGSTFGGNGSTTYALPTVTNRAPSTFMLAPSGLYPTRS